MIHFFDPSNEKMRAKLIAEKAKERAELKAAAEA